MAVNIKLQIIIRIFCILILIALCLAVYINGKNLKCSDCLVQFENTINSGSITQTEHFNVSITDLYNKFIINESCPLSYNKERGFYYG